MSKDIIPYEPYEDRDDLLGRIEAQAFLAMDSPFLPDGGRLSFPSVNVHDIPVDGIGCHYGVDRTLYYDLYSGERKLISMNDWRLEEFLSGNPDSDLRKIHEGMVGDLARKAAQTEKDRKVRRSPRQEMSPAPKRGPRR